MEICISALVLHHFRYNLLTIYRLARDTLVEISSFKSIEARSTLSLCLIASLFPRLLYVLHSRFSVPKRLNIRVLIIQLESQSIPNFNYNFAINLVTFFKIYKTYFKYALKFKTFFKQKRLHFFYLMLVSLL